MRGHRRRFARIAPSTIGVALACALAASSAGAVTVKDVWMPAPAAPGTPTSFNVPGVHLKANTMEMVLCISSYNSGVAYFFRNKKLLLFIYEVLWEIYHHFSLKQPLFLPFLTFEAHFPPFPLILCINYAKTIFSPPE